MSWTVSRSAGFIFDMTYLLFSPDPIEVVSMEKDGFALLANGELLFCVSGRIVPTSLSRVTSICSTGSAIAYVQDGDVKVFTVDNVGATESRSEHVFDGSICDLVEMNGLILARTDTAVEVRENSGCSAEFPVDGIRLWCLRERPGGGFKAGIVSGESTLTVVKFSTETNGFSVLASRSFDEPLYAIASFDRYFVIGIGNELRLVRVSNHHIEFRKALAGRSCPIVHIAVQNELIWTAEKNSFVAVYRYDPANDRFELCCSRSFSDELVQLKPFDDLSAVLCFRHGLVLFLAVPNHACHGWLREFGGALPSFHVLARFITPTTVTCIVVGEKAFIYATVDGSVGALVPIVSRQDANELVALHIRARQLYQEKIGLVRENPRSLLSVGDVVDSDVMELYSRLDHTEPIPQSLGQILGGILREMSF
jgi:hypothetical protein